MKLVTKLYKNTLLIKNCTTESSDPDIPRALADCVEQACTRLDLAEPVWLSKHTRELSLFRRVKLTPEDFMEPVWFDVCEFEYYLK